MKFGVHVSIAGGINKSIDRALALNCDIFQIFTRSSRSWKAKKLDEKQCQQLVSSQIQKGNSNSIMHTIMKTELALGRFIRYPVGIRCTVTLKKTLLEPKK